MKEFLFIIKRHGNGKHGNALYHVYGIVEVLDKGYFEKSFVKMYEDEMQGYNDEMAKEDAESNDFEFLENGEVYFG